MRNPDSTSWEDLAPLNEQDPRTSVDTHVLNICRNLSRLKAKECALSELEEENISDSVKWSNYSVIYEFSHFDIRKKIVIKQKYDLKLLHGGSIKTGKAKMDLYFIQLLKIW